MTPEETVNPDFIIKGRPSDELATTLFGEDMLGSEVDRMILYKVHILGSEPKSNRSKELVWVFRAESDIEATQKVRQRLDTINRDKQVWVDNPLPRREIQFTDAHCWFLVRVVRDLTLRPWETKLISDGEVMFEIS